MLHTIVSSPVLLAVIFVLYAVVIAIAVMAWVSRTKNPPYIFIEDNGVPGTNGYQVVMQDRGGVIWTLTRRIAHDDDEGTASQTPNHWLLGQYTLCFEHKVCMACGTTVSLLCDEFKMVIDDDPRVLDMLACVPAQIADDLLEHPNTSPI